VEALNKLAACAGDWRGTSRLQDPENNVADDSASAATVTPVLKGKFIRLDYTWAYHEDPQEGSLLMGHDAKTRSLTAHWIDTWHMGNKVMACQGAIAENGVISLLGSYAAPPGPDWGWRTIVTPGDDGTLSLVMYNIYPDGREELAVESHYNRA